MKVADMHCDTLNELKYAFYRGEQLDFGRNDLQVDLEKLRAGDYMLQSFALFTHFDGQDPLVEAIDEYDQFRRLLAEYPNDIRQVRTMAEIAENRDAGRISALLTVEDSGCCRGNLSVLRLLYELGVRIMTITWNHENELGYPNLPAKDGSTDFPGGADTIHGLKETGFAFIHEMERLGIIIDVSHLSDAGFWDVYRSTARPFIASHSNARAVTEHARNLTDDMIRAIADRGGVTGINYCSRFVDTEHKEHPVSRVTYMADHIEYIRRVGGIDMIGLGSDFDGIEGDLELCDPSRLPLLERELRHRGFHEREIEQIFSGNVLRVLGEFLPER